jgi:cytochrome c oxidase subunit 2
MPIVVKAVDRSDFDQWVAGEQAAAAAQRAASGVTYTRDQLVAAGRKVFDDHCAACHQPNGLGLPGAFPPIAGGHPFAAAPPMIAALRARGFYKAGDIVVGPLANHIRIVLHGIPGTPMPAFASQLSAADIAAVITYERNDFGNHTGETVEPAQVTALQAGH